MRTKKPTVTIGIPAYNEEANIGYLLKNLLAQKYSTFKFDKIIVSSDGSTDGTVSVVKKIQSRKIQLFNSKDRKGIAARLNQITKISHSDILVLLNADILIKDTKFIEKLIVPIINNKADLTSARIEQVARQNLMEKILYVSMRFKSFVFEQYKQGNNIYTCYGLARAFSKKLYKTLHIPSSIGEDAYTYLYCVYNNFTYQHVKSAKLLYKLPANLLDHERQSVRFFESKRKFINAFGEVFVKSQYHIPPYLFLISFLRFLVRHPLYMVLYFLVYWVMKVKSLFKPHVGETWDISTSSKVLR